MEEKFISAWAHARAKARELGVKMRPVPDAQALQSAQRCLSGRRLSDGFNDLHRRGHLELSLEALAIDKRYTGLFTDEQANEALNRLLEVGYRF